MDQPFVLQSVEGLAQGEAAYIQLLGELHLSGQPVSRSEAFVLDKLYDLLFCTYVCQHVYPPFAGRRFAQLKGKDK
jgi:hypothetical protein